MGRLRGEPAGEGLLGRRGEIRSDGVPEITLEKSGDKWSGGREAALVKIPRAVNKGL